MVGYLLCCAAAVLLVVDVVAICDCPLLRLVKLGSFYQGCSVVRYVCWTLSVVGQT